MKIPIAKLSRTEWLALRKTGIGASDMGAVCGLNQYRTPLEVYLEKTDQLTVEQNDAMLLGQLIEPVIATFYTHKTGTRVRKSSFSYRMDGHSFMLCNIDRLIGRDGLLECKRASVFTKDRWGETGTDEVPEEYLVQVQHELACTGRKWCDLAVLFSDNEFRVYRLSRDEELIKLIIDKGRRFWDCVTTMTPPDPSTEKDVLLLHPEDDGMNLEATSPILTEYMLWERAKLKIKRWEGTKSDAAFKMKEFMGDASELWYETEKLVTWKTNKKGTRVFK